MAVRSSRLRYDHHVAARLNRLTNWLIGEGSSGKATRVDLKRSTELDRVLTKIVYNDMSAVGRRKKGGSARRIWRERHLRDWSAAQPA